MTVTNNTNNYSASDIGASFVETYYGTLAQSPHKLALLYKQDSQITHNSVNADNESSFYQGKEIEPALQEFTNGVAKNVKVKLHLVESQSSIKNSLLVNVHGAFQKTTSSDVVHFSQTFVLATQKPNGYYVLNDILKLENNKSSQLNGGRDIEVDSTAATMGEGSVHSFSEEEIRSIEAASSVDDKDSTDLKEEQVVKKTEKKHPKKKDVADKNDEVKKTTPVEKKYPKKKDEVKKTADQSAKKSTATTQAPVATKSDAPTTYAAIVGGDDYVVTIQTQQQNKPEKKKRTGPKPEKKQNKNATETEQPAKSSENAGAEKRKKKFERKSPATPVSADDKKQETTGTDSNNDDGFEQKKTKKYVKKDKPFKKFNNNNNNSNNSTSSNISSNNNSNGEEKEQKPRKVFNDDNKFGVYVARVDPTTTTQQLQEAFSKYGEIVDMNNRSRANEKKPKFKLGYALVFYNNQESVNKAIEEKEVAVNGQKVAISLHSRKSNKTN